MASSKKIDGLSYEFILPKFNWSIKLKTEKNARCEAMDRYLTDKLKERSETLQNIFLIFFEIFD